MSKNLFPVAKPQQVYLLTAYIIPVVLLLWFVARFSVNVPMWDQWALVDFFDKVATGSANFEDFFAQHNEHRMVFPKFIFVILAFASSWNIKVELLFSIFLSVLIFCTLFKIASATKSCIKFFHPLNIITCFLTFSFVQYENWLWGFQIAWFLINACAILAVFWLTVPKKWHPHFRLSLSAICCLVASFSSAHGLLSWLAVIPSVASIEGNAKQRKFRLLLWILLFILSFTIYYIDYQKPDHHPAILFFLKEPIVAGTYFLTIIGSPFGKLILPPVIIGLFILLNFLFFNWYCIKNYNTKLATDSASWLSIGWFATLFALITTLGRAGFGVEQALASRYTTVLILLTISVLQMWRLWINHKWKGSDRNAYLISTYSFFAGALIILFISSSTEAIAQVQQTSLRRASGATCLETIHFLDKSIYELPDSCLKSLFPKPASIKRWANSLDRIDFREVPRSITFTSDPIEVHGYIDSPPTTGQPLIFPRNGSIKVLGWAILPARREQPKTVFLSYGKNQSFFANGVVELERLDVAKALKSSQYTKVGWEANISFKFIPLGETVIKAWVYDPEGKRFVKLSGEPKIKVVE